MQTGTVSRLNCDRGFGFIQGRCGDYFFHCKELSAELPFTEALKERAAHFEVLDTGKGQRTVNVRPAY